MRKPKSNGMFWNSTDKPPFSLLLLILLSLLFLLLPPLVFTLSFGSVLELLLLFLLSILQSFVVFLDALYFINTITVTLNAVGLLLSFQDVTLNLPLVEYFNINTHKSTK